MILPRRRIRRLTPSWVLQALAGASLVAVGGAAARPADADALHIGTTTALTGKADGPKEKASRESLRSFIKDQTGRDNDVVGPKSWQEIADQMAAGRLQLGFFQGYEFAWAQEKQADLKPLAVGVDGDLYPTVCVVERVDGPAGDFAGLKGFSLSMPAAQEGLVRLFLEHQAPAGGKKMGDYFSKITLADNAEDPLDDVVDGVVQAAAVERAALDAFQRRKPARFKRLKEVVRSQPFPPTVVAYFGSALDDASLRSFKDGLLGAANKPKGQTLLALAHLTGFEAVPADLGRVLADTRKAYPAPDAGGK